MIYLSHSAQSGAITAHSSKKERTAWCERTGATPITMTQAKTIRPTWSAGDWKRFTALADFQG